MSSKTLRVKLLITTALVLSAVAVATADQQHPRRACLGSMRPLHMGMSRSGIPVPAARVWQLQDLRQFSIPTGSERNGPQGSVPRSQPVKPSRHRSGQTSKFLLSDLRFDPTTRRAVAAAKIIVIWTGADDLEPAFNAYGAGACGGSDNSDCFRLVAAEWRTKLDAILVQVRKFRAGKRTAIRVITNSNKFLAGPNFAALARISVERQAC